MLSADVEELVISYLSGFFSEVSTEMPANPNYPFILVNGLGGPDDLVTEYATVSIHAFNATRTEASDAARLMHKHMKEWTAKIPVQMSDGYASVDYIKVLESPHWEDYADQTIHRYCARYRIELRLNQTN